MNAVLFLGAVVAMTTFGDYLLKLASLRESPFTSAVFIGGAAIYALSAVGWVYSMRHMSLAAIGVYYSVLMVILLAVMGVVLFGEKLTAREVLGLVLACASIGLMARLH